MENEAKKVYEDAGEDIKKLTCRLIDLTIALSLERLDSSNVGELVNDIFSANNDAINKITKMALTEITGSEAAALLNTTKKVLELIDEKLKTTMGLLSDSPQIAGLFTLSEGLSILDDLIIHFVEIGLASIYKAGDYFDV